MLLFQRVLNSGEGGREGGREGGKKRREREEDEGEKGRWEEKGEREETQRSYIFT